MTGTLKGDTITLDHPGEQTPPEGQRVRVTIEPVSESEQELPAEEHARLWRDWVENGPQGPIEE